VTPQQIPKDIKQYMQLVAGTDDIVEACRMWTECAGEYTPTYNTKNGKVKARWMVYTQRPDELLPIHSVQSGRLPGGFEPITGGNALRLLVAKIAASGVHIGTRLRAA
jgi:hypothetical protein